MGFDTINNFQLGQTKFDISFDTALLSFADTQDGAEILKGSDVLAVVSFAQASTFTNNLSEIFV